MQIRLIGETEGLLEGAALLCGDLGIELSDDGLTIEVRHTEGQLSAHYSEGRGVIGYDQPIHFYRALGLWVEHYRRGAEFSVAETPQFERNGAMIDVSRNAVLTVESVRLLLRKMALMGLNWLMLYTEDTFAIEEYPYFGYMRGRYSPQELRACDDYAAKLGIEMTPCIQTLAHLTEALKWNYAAGVRDTPDILLVGEEETYRLIERMLRAASAPFRSRRIHIGMDEAHQLGLGRYLDRHGYRKRFDIMNEHLQRVARMAGELGLQPMIWSDMYFRLGSATGSYYDLDADIPAEVIEGMPGNVQFVYWDYYHADASFYREYIRRHRAFGSMPVFAGGVWTWNGIAPNYGKTVRTTEAALAACKEEGVREVFATMWGDDGAETSVFAGLAGLQLFAEHGYADAVDERCLAERFAFCTGGRYGDFLALNRFDETPGVAEGNLDESNPAKCLLWQDALIGLFDGNIAGLPLAGHYARLKGEMAEAARRNGEWNALFGFYAQLAAVLAGKSELGLRLKAAYDRRDRAGLQRLRGEMGELIAMADELRKRHRALWLSRCKAFGWEVLDIRYGGVLSRLETACQRIDDYTSGRLERIEELEEERLYYDAPYPMPEGALGRGTYQRIATASPLSR
ncbi:beta-N-acetylhexosaminidase [Paenibacillus ginsengihumi]|uniref:beta-N-acetylhexosaminidase n=1 Tax=Paenibacillus ginsengihumi TaxID=431596 RepID=UPI00037264EB|nr:beta-N-acetylhexosaminidase [Paenibacillus ginsengihumi]